MHYELYVDRIFFVQFIMNLLLLILTAAAGRLRIHPRRLAAAAAAGSFFYLVIFLAPLGNGRLVMALKTLLQAAGSFLVLGFGFGLTGADACMRAGTIYGISACLLGGAMTIFLKGSAKNWWQILLPSAMLALAGLIWTKKERRRSRRNRYTVCIKEGNCSLKVQALMDSGNSLADPLSGAPVCIVHKSVIESLGLSKKPERFRAIPYHSIGKLHGILNAWSVEKMYIRSEGQNLAFERVLLAESGLPLSETEEYQMLLHPALLEEKKGDNHDFKSCDAGKDAV